MNSSVATRDAWASVHVLMGARRSPLNWPWWVTVRNRGRRNDRWGSRYPTQQKSTAWL